MRSSVISRYSIFFSYGMEMIGTRGSRGELLWGLEGEWKIRPKRVGGASEKIKIKRNKKKAKNLFFSVKERDRL